MNFLFTLHVVFASIGLGLTFAALGRIGHAIVKTTWVALLGTIATGAIIAMSWGVAGRQFGTTFLLKGIGALLLVGFLYWGLRDFDPSLRALEAPKRAAPFALWLLVFLLGIRLTHP